MKHCVSKYSAYASSGSPLVADQYFVCLIVKVRIVSKTKVFIFKNLPYLYTGDR